jgi:hypothetical protein
MVAILGMNRFSLRLPLKERREYDELTPSQKRAYRNLRESGITHDLSLSAVYSRRARRR